MSWLNSSPVHLLAFIAVVIALSQFVMRLFSRGVKQQSTQSVALSTSSNMPKKATKSSWIWLAIGLVFLYVLFGWLVEPGMTFAIVLGFALVAVVVLLVLA